MRLGFAIALILGALRPAHAQVTLLDTAGDVGMEPSLAIGVDGKGLIAYYDATNGDLKVAHCNDESCSGATLSAIDTGPLVGRVSSLAIGADGRGIISYSYVAVGPLKVAHCHDVACTSATLTFVDPQVVAGQTAIAVGTDGLPLIAFVRRTPATGALELVAAHCSNTACTTSTVSVLRTLPYSDANRFDVSAVIGADGLALIAYVPVDSLPSPGLTIGMAHCANVECSALTPTPAPTPGRRAETPEAGQDVVQRPSLAIGADGLALVSYRHSLLSAPPVDVIEYRIRHCADTACTSFTSDVSVPTTSLEGVNAPLAMSPAGLPWFVRAKRQKVRLAECTDAACLTWTEKCAVIDGGAKDLALARGTDGQPLAAFYRATFRDLGVVHGFGPCLPSVVSVSDAQMGEGGPPFGTAFVSVDTPPDVFATVDYSTIDGTAMAGHDYQPVSGTLTLGGAPKTVALPPLHDLIDEPDEHFSIVLSNPQGVTIGDGTGVATIFDDDPPPVVTIGECHLVEGTGGATDCGFPVSLSLESGKEVSVGYATHDETASAGPDYTAATGVLSFAPGTTIGTVPVAVAGDAAAEDDETFRLELGSVVNATLLGGQAQGVILDDDAPSLSNVELTHGSILSADLSAQPGPAADIDFYRLAQPPFTSWEVQVDDVSGDVAPDLVLERLSADGTTVLQTAVAVGAGGARSLSFQNRLGAPIVSQHIRVTSSGCGTDCGSDDVYRLRAFETTARIARYSNIGSQVTVLILQNTTTLPVQASIDFWGEPGERLATRTADLPPRSLHVLDTSTIPSLEMTSGSITITHDAPYGGLAGKAVALQLYTGFSFDSPLEYRPR